VTGLALKTAMDYERLQLAWARGRILSSTPESDAEYAVLAEDRSSPGVYFVRLGSFDSDPGVRPSHHQFVDYAAAWDVVPDDGLPLYGERVPADVRQAE